MWLMWLMELVEGHEDQLVARLGSINVEMLEQSTLVLFGMFGTNEYYYEINSWNSSQRFMLHCVCMSFASLLCNINRHFASESDCQTPSLSLARTTSKQTKGWRDKRTKID